MTDEDKALWMIYFCDPTPGVDPDTEQSGYFAVQELDQFPGSTQAFRSAVDLTARLYKGSAEDAFTSVDGRRVGCEYVAPSTWELIAAVRPRKPVRYQDPALFSTLCKHARKHAKANGREKALRGLWITSYGSWGRIHKEVLEG